MNQLNKLSAIATALNPIAELLCKLMTAAVLSMALTSSQHAHDFVAPATLFASALPVTEGEQQAVYNEGN